MNVPVKLAAFTAAIAVVFAGTYAGGALAGPVGFDAGHGTSTSGGVGHDAAGGDHRGEPKAVSGPGGLAVAADGYTLRQVSAAPTAGQAGEFVFQILDAAGMPVTGFQTSQHADLVHTAAFTATAA